MGRRKFTAKFKTKVVLESLKEAQSMSDLAQKYELAPAQISAWKREFLSRAEDIFTKPKKSVKTEANEERNRLLQTIILRNYSFFWWNM